MQPLRVVAVMESGQLATMDGLVHLDGILAWAWMRRHNPRRLDAAPGDDLIDPMLPLKRIVPDHDPGAWHWACSAAHFDPVREYLTHWHKRFRVEQEHYLDLSGRKSGRIDTSSGLHKNYRIPLPIVLVDRVEWYAFGNRREVAKLLRMVEWIGKKRSQGYGRVAQWIVEPWPHDWSLYGPDGEPTRAIPAQENRADDWQGIRPPHWHISTRRPVIVPRRRRPIPLEEATVCEGWS